MTAALAVVLALALALLLAAIDRAGAAMLQSRRALLRFDPYGHL
jgi:formate hydrogenlyase subunit 4